MNKSELIDAIAQNADLTKTEAGNALNATLSAITASLKKGEDVTLIGFGTFKIAKRAAREGRNPATGDAIQIAACNAPTFSAGKTLKSAVN